MYPSDLKYTEEHEWVRVEKDTAIIGITAYASEELGEIVFVELPESGAQKGQMEEFGSVESVKTVSSLYTPIGGKIIGLNDAVIKNPALIGESPYEDGWLIKLKLSDPKELDDLMTAAEYQKYLESPH